MFISAVPMQLSHPKPRVPCPGLSSRLSRQTPSRAMSSCSTASVMCLRPSIPRSLNCRAVIHLVCSSPFRREAFLKQHLLTFVSCSRHGCTLRYVKREFNSKFFMGRGNKQEICGNLQKASGISRHACLKGLGFTSRFLPALDILHG